MATDIAFAIGALSLLGARIPKSLITFLIALAIVDDLGAVAVIAVFYTESLNVQALFYAVLFSFVLLSMNLGGIRHSLPYALVGAMLWTSMLASGIHATIAGIIIAFTIPIQPKFKPEHFINKVKDITVKMQKSVAGNPDVIHNNRFRALVSTLGDGVHRVQAPAQRAEHILHLPVAYIVIPIFALANAGIPIDFAQFGQYLGHPVTQGVLVGLLLGKPAGIVGFTWLIIKMGWAELPEELNMKHVLGVGLLGGIGFTMSIFIADLGFVGMPDDLLMAKTGILLASLIAGVSGFFWLKLHTRDRVAEQ
jgi:NhaA family Na+:H+ antiporter